MPKRSREHALEEESRRFCRDLFPSRMVVRDKGDDYGIDFEVEVFDEHDAATGLIFYVQLKGTDAEKERTQKEVRVSADKFDYWLGLDCPTVVMRYCSNKGNPRVFWMVNYDHAARSTESGKNYVYDFDDSNLWGDGALEELLAEVSNDRLINASSLKLPITLELSGRAKEILSSQNTSSLLRYSHYVRLGWRMPNRATVNIGVEESQWVTRIGRRNQLIFSLQNETPESFASDVVLAAALCLHLRGHSTMISRVALKCFDNAEIVSDSQICDSIATALLENGKLRDLHSICQIAVRRCFTIEPFRALLFTPVLKAQLIEKEQLIEQLRNYDQLIENAKLASADIQALIYYAKGSFEITLKRSNDALRSFLAAIKLNAQTAHHPMLWSQTASLFFWKKQWNAAAYHYLFALKLQGERHWETKGNFADTQWRRGALGSALFWLRKVVDDPEAAKDPRFGWFRFLLSSVQWVKDFAGGSRFAPSPNLVTLGLAELDDKKCKSSLEVLKDLVKQDFSRIELWERLVDQAEQTHPEIAFRLEMMATACDYSNCVRWAFLVIRGFYDPQVSEDCKRLIAETALAINSDAIAAAIHIVADGDSFPIPAHVLHKLADEFESAPHRELTRYIRPLEIKKSH